MSDLFNILTKGIKIKKTNKFHNNSTLINTTNNANKNTKTTDSTLSFDFFDSINSNDTSINYDNASPVIKETSKKRKLSSLIKSDKVTNIHENNQLFNNQEEINAFRNRLSIHIHGHDCPVPSASFATMDIEPSIKNIILKNIEETSDWKEPTAVQMQAIPSLLNERDILVSAPTGSGKTAAYMIPILSQITKYKIISRQLSDDNCKGIHSLILVPTKELAEQVHREGKRLSQGKNIKISVLKKAISSNALSQQDKKVLSKYDLIISTPMRLLQLLRADAIDLSHIQMLIFDEVDKLFELDGQENGEDISRSSFLNQVDEILQSCPTSGVLKGLFSATISPFVQDLASSILQQSFIKISIGVVNSGASTIDQKLTFVGRDEGKLLAIRQIVQNGLHPPVLIFLQSKDRAKELFRELVYDGINVDIIHSERTSQQREEVIKRFRVGDIWVLICTDLMARGVDFKGVNMVINYDLPLSG